MVERRAASAARCHAAACRQASSSTQRPSGTISPVSSASGMNSPAAAVRARGGSQRTSASTPAIAPVAELDDRLVDERELAALDGAGAGRPRARARSTAPSCIARLEDLVAALAARLGRYIATSASRSSAVGGRRRVGVASAMPTLAVTRPRVRPPSVERRRRARRRTRSRDRDGLVGVAERPRAGWRTRRRRAGRRCRRRGAQPRSRVGDLRRAVGRRRAWPRLSLTVLKSSRSSEEDGDRRDACRSAAGAVRASRRSVNSARFGRPVSASCRAWWRAASSALRSVMSRAFRTMPPTAGSSSEVRGERLQFERHAPSRVEHPIEDAAGLTGQGRRGTRARRREGRPGARRRPGPVQVLLRAHPAGAAPEGAEG